MGNIEKSDLSQIEAEITVLKHQTAQNIIEIGKRLIKAKELVPYGEWEEWLGEKVDFSTRRAQQFMKVAREFGETKMSSVLTLDKMLELTTLEVEEREKFIKNNPVEDMTTRELRQAIKEKKELENKIKELESKPPKVIEKEVVKEVVKVPDDYEELKEKEKHLTNAIEDLRIKMQSQVDSKDYNRLRKEYEEKVNEVYDLKDQLKQTIVTDSEEQHRQKLKDTALTFSAKVHNFINSTGGLAWLTDYIDELGEYEKKEYIKAIDLLESWVLTVKSNINKEEL